MDGPTFWSAVGAIGTSVAAVVAVLAYLNSRNGLRFGHYRGQTLARSSRQDKAEAAARSGGTGSFVRGKLYTRSEIHKVVRGSKQSYLPRVGSRIVAACLNPDLNPDAPSVILPGTGQEREASADLLAKQSEPVPTFLKRGSGRWEYVGDFIVGRYSRDAEEIAAQARRAGRTDITSVLYMVPADSLADSNAE